ncbi:ATPase [Streptomyces carminius]|uniref:ATPase n=1 Tax=Streptomyces carminius TaxID=2665496 RepID=A0A2M8LYW5_9ACTN|nr:RNase adapter RapZ [Streptomyces carminius]PJE97157.1 ATPase [Streptomyces carminius]
MAESTAPPVRITSFGYGHCRGGLRIPRAHLVLDLRTHFRDPHVAPELRHMTARDQEVRDAVLSTPGISELVEATAAAVRAYQAGPTTELVTVAVGCTGGRHRAPTVALAVARALRLAHDWQAVTVIDRDIERSVIAR